MTLELYTNLILLGGLSFTGFGILAYTQNPRAISNKLFALLSISFAIWSFSWFFMLIFANNMSLALLSARALHFGAIWIPVFFVQWIFGILDITEKRKFILRLAYAIAIFFSALNITPYFIQGVQQLFFFPAWPQPGVWYIWYIIIGYGLLVGYSLFEIAIRFPGLNGSKKFQILYVLFGAVLGFGGGATNFLGMYQVPFLSPLWIFTGALGVMVSPYFFAYSAIRHNLMSVKVIFSEVFAAILIIALLLRVMTSRDPTELTQNIFILGIVTIAVYLLIKSVMREVEQRERLQYLSNKLETANEELRKLDQAKSEFISIASHQLRAPLTSIKGYLSMVLEGSFGTVTEQTKGILNRVTLSTNQLLGLMESLLNLSRIESGRIQYELTEGDYPALIAGVIQDLIPPARAKGIRIVFSSSYENGLTFTFDAQKMKEVAVNIVDNAIKYSPPSSEISVSIKPSPSPGMVRLTVKDNGIGIAKEDLSRLFVKFARTKEAQAADPNGMGIGIYFVKRVVEDHGGVIWVESEGMGKGCSFFVELPFHNQNQNFEIRKSKQ